MDVEKHRAVEFAPESGEFCFQNSSLLLEALVASSDDAIITKDLNGIVTSWNPAAVRIFGYEASEMTGQSILRLIPERMRDEETEILRQLRAGHKIEHFETLRVTKDGRELAVSLTISPVKDKSGCIVGVSKVLRDITERRRIEKSLLQAEKIAASGKMAATIAHEINNPLEAVLNLIYLARTNATEVEEVRSYLKSAESELVRLSHIAKQTLGFYRETAMPVKMSLSEVAGETLGIYVSKLRQSGIQVESRLQSDATIMMKRGEMMQTISNLITNAANAMPEGGRLVLSVESTTLEGKAGLTLSVEDTGVGIPKENLQRIFEAFFTTREAVGTGIGLWVARQFVVEHGGRIDVTSSTEPVTHGTKFMIFLPSATTYAA